MTKGKAILLGDNVKAKMIYPEKYQSEIDSDTTVEHLFEDLDVAMPGESGGPGIIVAGENFGHGPDCGAAVNALLAAGISCVVARSFGRNFYRKAVNTALPVIAADLVDKVQNGDEIEIDFQTGTMALPNGEYAFEPYPDFVQKIIDCGGLMPFVKKNISAK
jgi:3-isopropylmalate/(R)-2-methylmalate dehydratase small subunit